MLSFNSFQIMESLNADPYCRQLKLSDRLQSIAYIVESYSGSGPVSPLPPSQHLTSPSHMHAPSLISSPSHMHAPTLVSSPTQLTSAHLQTLPHITATSSHHSITSIPHMTSSPHVSCPQQHLGSGVLHHYLPSSVSTHTSLTSSVVAPVSQLQHLSTPHGAGVPGHHPHEYIHHHHGSSSSSHHTLPSNNSSQLSEL